MTDQQDDHLRGCRRQIASPSSTKSFTDQALDKELRAATATREPQRPEGRDRQARSRTASSCGATQFPTQHLVDLINKANTGETFYETSLFDGSERWRQGDDHDGDRRQDDATPPANDPELQALDRLGKEKFWPVDIAYFDETIEGGEEAPEYRISLQAARERADPRPRRWTMATPSFRGQLVDLAVVELYDEVVLPIDEAFPPGVVGGVDQPDPGAGPGHKWCRMLADSEEELLIRFGFDDRRPCGCSTRVRRKPPLPCYDIYRPR